MNIIADENIPYAKELFGRAGSVTSLPGRGITPEHLKNADALIVRSITKVNESLLKDSAVKFVGTATIGMDHIDRAYLRKQGIGFSSAPGCNANSVSEYITAALLLLAEKSGRPLEGSSIAIIGVGNVGSRVYKKAQALGMRCLLNDPPKQRETGSLQYLPINEVLPCADYVTVHVPLEITGADKTYRMVNNKFLAHMKNGAVFLNSSRGDVVCEADLRAQQEKGRVSEAVLDVWENEPDISTDTAARVFLGSPHIAGYSFDGKVHGTTQIYQAFCQWFKIPCDTNLSLPEAEVPEIDLRDTEGSDEDLIRKAVLKVYDIRIDDRNIRDILPELEKGKAFDHLRKTYRIRREFQHTRVILPPSRDGLAEKMAGLGFVI